jgi:hypothetical protein
MLVPQGTSYARVVFADAFEYEVQRSDPNARQIFVSQGWSHAKTQQDASGAKGYFYTVNSIPGFTGRFPGTDSSRVVLMEALPGTLGYQTDFYLELGNGSSAAHDNFIPGDVWIQFWIYPQHFGNQLSRFGTRNKFIYACNSTYPCSQYQWMLSWGSNTYNQSNMNPRGNPTNGEFFFHVASPYANKAGDENPDQLGQTNLSDWPRPNRWTLVKMRFNTTRTTGNSWEMWLRPYGGAWIKVAEWIGGVTPGFTWDIPSNVARGHRVVRMPTTVGATTGQWYDSWTYMDDFVIATTEQDLPVYSDGGPSPEPPRDLVAE